MITGTKSKRSCAHGMLTLLVTLAMAWGFLPGVAVADEVEVEPDDGQEAVVEVQGDEASGQVQTQDTHQNHDNITFTKWESTNSLPGSSGSYYLTDNVTLNGPWIVPTDHTNLCLNGKTISFADGSYNNGCIYVGHTSSGAASLTLYDCGQGKAGTITSAPNTRQKLCVHVNSDASTFEMKGGTICGFGGGVFVNGGTFTMYDGAQISGNAKDSSEGGAGAYITGGRFVMNGGTICNNVAGSTSNGNTGYGGGVRCLNAQTTFEMNGGTISNNVVRTSSPEHIPRGGGVFCNSGATFIMRGGTIENNHAIASPEGQGYGGGVSLKTDTDVGTRFQMSGGTIRNNTSDGVGGGVFLESDLRFACYSVLELSGDAHICDNTQGPDDAKVSNDVGLSKQGEDDQTRIKLTGKLTSTDKIFVGIFAKRQTNTYFYVCDVPTTGTFVDGYADVYGSEDPSMHFQTSDDDFALVWTVDHTELRLAKMYRATVDPDIVGGALRLQTDNPDQIPEGTQVTIIATPDDGNEVASVIAKGVDGTAVEVLGSGATWSLTMPDQDVIVSATFSKKPEPEPKPEPTPEPEPEPEPVVPVATVTAHVQRKGWLAAVSGGAVAGTTGQSRRLESLTLTVPDAGVEGGIEYRSHVQKTGWEKTWKRDGKRSGTVGKARRMEAVQIRLYGELADKYDVYYRVHVKRLGWMAWAKNSAKAGTTGQSRRAEAIQVVLVPKGDPAPGATFQGVTQTYAKAFVKK